MTYGFFNDKEREYVITRPDTPLPWNQLSGLRGVLRDHLQHGRRVFLLSRSTLASRNTLRYNNAPLDFRRTVYLRA